MTIDDSRDALIVFEILVSFFFFYQKKWKSTGSKLYQAISRNNKHIYIENCFINKK